MNVSVEQLNIMISNWDYIGEYVSNLWIRTDILDASIDETIEILGWDETIEIVG
jgi:hypothetical protein